MTHNRPPMCSATGCPARHPGFGASCSRDRRQFDHLKRREFVALLGGSYLVLGYKLVDVDGALALDRDGFDLLGIELDIIALHLPAASSNPGTGRVLTSSMYPRLIRSGTRTWNNSHRIYG